MDTSSLRTFFGSRAQDDWIDALSKLGDTLGAHYNFSLLRWQHFLAQIAHETDCLSLNPMRENMNYRSAARVKQVFSKRLGMALKLEQYAKYASVDILAQACVGNPEFLAGIAYGGREGTPPGCGLYVGRGPLQITHLNNYKAVQDEILKQPGGAGVDLVASPQLLEQPEIGIRSAFADWQIEGLSVYADKDDIAAVSAKLNVGGARKVSSVIGLSSRAAYLKKAKQVWPNSTSTSGESAYTQNGEAGKTMAKAKTTDTTATADEPAPWLDEALSRLGQKEIKGSRDNPLITQCFVDAGHDLKKEALTDETAWCAAGACSCLKRTGYPIPPPNVNLMARSFTTYGVGCEAKRGAIVVFARGAYPQGHVAFVAKVNKNGTVDIVGGNQSDSWSLIKGQYKVKDALAFRWPVEPTIAGLRAAGSTEINNADNAQTGVLIAGGVTSVGAALAPTAVNPVPVPLLPTADQLQKAGDNAGLMQTLFDAMTAIGHTLRDNPWIVGMVLGGGLIWYLARKGKLKRLQRLLQGQPLSSEV